MAKTDETVDRPLTYDEAFEVLPEPETGAQEFIQQTIANTVALLTEKAGVQAELQEARNFLAMAGKSGASAEQVDWINTYLPKRTRVGNVEG